MKGKRLLAFFMAFFLVAAGLYLTLSIAGYLFSGGQSSPGGAAGEFLADRGLFLLGWVVLWFPFVCLLIGIKLFSGFSPHRWWRLVAGLCMGFVALLILLALPFLSEDAGARAVTRPSSGAAGYLLANWLREKAGWAGLLAFGGFFTAGCAVLLGSTSVLHALDVGARAVATSLRRSVIYVLAAVRSAGRYLKDLFTEAPDDSKKARRKSGSISSDTPKGEKEQGDEKGKGEEKKKKQPEIIMNGMQNESQSRGATGSFRPAASGASSSGAGYKLPPLHILHEGEKKGNSGEEEGTIRRRGEILERTLQEFNIEAEVVRVQRGPVVTMYEMSLSPGTKVSKVESLDDDLAIALKAPNVRIVAPIPGKSTIGIEVPNAKRETVTIKELVSEMDRNASQMDIPLFLGKDTSGSPLIVDLGMAPHLLIAGATGSGKSISINSIICSIIMSRTPEEVQMLLVDPKSVEFADYQTLPHLICPVVTDMKKAAGVLQWACKKMDDRFSMLSRVGVRNIGQYNRLGKQKIIDRLEPEEDAEIDDVPFYMPHVVIIIDELGELMLVAAKEVESSVIRLSQKARAVGIHLICATQRPSADVITGLIKANLPVKIAFQVSSKINSRVILDRNGAELLLGRGDMLMTPPGSSRLVRAQGTFMSQAEAIDIVDFVSAQQEPQFKEELKGFNASEDNARSQEDELYDEAVQIVLETQRGSVSLLQRRLAIGYSRAARLVDMMAEAGLVGPYKGSQAREVHMTLEEWGNARTQSSGS